ncbi:D-2-hydroxyacid dehydrogenase [Bacillus sp. 03113]|uniref:D-2-hydroxyacid dehydrogenase n=1 Tax=Bacillus sp. 03113 TaxID=2578211 RepID=UPI00215D0510|nr:D-2-hydroxyacid dehydrogenase [Bacillus sp. 03113]
MSFQHQIISEPIPIHLFIRYKLADKYLDRIREICKEVIIEPWTYGHPEPKITHDLTKCNVVLTLGLQDPLNIIDQVPNLEWVQSTSVGLDALLNPRVKESSVLLTNTKGCTSVPIAEHTVALISSLSRGIPMMIRNQQQQKWELPPVMDLEKATVGIVGYGEIGKEIAKRCKSFDMNIIGCKKHVGKGKTNDDPADAIVGLNQIDDVLSQADFLVLALPSTDETYHFINKERLEKMKKGSFLINVGRGNTIAEDDLLSSLQNGHLTGAALDVFDVEPLPKEHPFWHLENVIVSPHHAYYSPKTMDRYMDLFIENLKRFSVGEPLLNVVNKELGY